MIRADIVVGTILFALVFIPLENARSQGPDLPNARRIERSQKLGPVRVDVALEPAQPLIGDPITLTVTVTAEKDVELLMPEFGEALDRFTILDFVPRERVDDEGRLIASQQYRLQPPSSGKQSIPPILIEFVDRRPGQKQAPDGFDAHEVLTSRIDFLIESVVPANASSELKPPLGQLRESVPGSRAIWRWIVVGLIALALTSWWLARRVLTARQAARRRSAFEIARKRLDMLLAKPFPKYDEIDGFYVQLSDIVRRYLEDRFDLRAPELTTEEFLDIVSGSPDLTNEHQVLLREFLRQADLVKFAGEQPDESVIHQSIAAAEWFIQETKEDAP